MTEETYRPTDRELWVTCFRGERGALLQIIELFEQLTLVAIRKWVQHGTVLAEW